MNALKMIIPIAMFAASAQAVEEDKQAHFIVSAAIGAAASSKTTIAVASTACLSIGVGKEVYDHYISGTGFNGGDIVADLIGCGVGVAFGRVALRPEIGDSHGLNVTYRF